MKARLPSETPVRTVSGANIPNRPPKASRRAAIGLGASLAVGLVLRTGLAPGARAQNAGSRPGSFVGGEGRFLFEARGVPVDVTAATVTEARERALTQGRIAGLRQVVEHLAPREDLAKLPTLSAEQAIEMVREFSIANEHTSAVRYIADMTVRYDPNAVRNLLRASKIRFTELASKPMLLLPVMMDGGRAVLWDDGNPWREAWAHLKDRSPLVPLLLPMGDLTDMKLRPEQVLAKDPAALQQLIERYETAGVVIAKLAGGAGEAPQVTVTQIRGGTAVGETSFTATPGAGQSREDILLAAAAETADAIAQSWIKRNLIDVSVTAQLTALAQVKDLKDWIGIRERLKEVPLVLRVDLQALTRDRAQITLRYAGDQSHLQAALAEQSLALAQQGGVWVLASRKPTGEAAR